MTAILIAILSKPLNLNKNLYTKLFFAAFLVTTSISILSYLTPITIFVVVGSFYLYFTFAFVILHSSKNLGNKNTLIFFLIALLFGLFSEAVGVKYGWIFGSYYYYGFSTFFFGLVPLATPISWAIIIYISYTISNLFLVGFGGEKPKKTDRLWYSVILITVLSSISGLIAVNLDMILDPVSVSTRVPGWIWIGGGPYFGIPISNFIGWFSVTAVAIFIFRCYESISSKLNTYSTFNIYSNFSIILIYLLYFVYNAVKAFELGKIEYILIGATTMIPFILIALLVLILNKKRDE
jgi:putative membrane protein